MTKIETVSEEYVACVGVALRNNTALSKLYTSLQGSCMRVALWRRWEEGGSTRPAVETQVPHTHGNAPRMQFLFLLNVVDSSVALGTVSKPKCLHLASATNLTIMGHMYVHMYIYIYIYTYGSFHKAHTIGEGAANFGNPICSQIAMARASHESSQIRLSYNAVKGP